MNGAAHWFWTIIVLACLVWYSTMVLFVTFRGAIDIRGMLARLKQGQLDDDTEGWRPSKQ